SVPLQNWLSSHAAVFAGCTHAPLPSHSSSVQTLPSSVQEVPAASKKFSPLSLQRSAHSPPPRHGLPACPQALAAHVSTPLQNTPSSHAAVLLGCAQTPAPLHASSVQTL